MASSSKKLDVDCKVTITSSKKGKATDQSCNAMKNSPSSATKATTAPKNKNQVCQKGHATSASQTPKSNQNLPCKNSNQEPKKTNTKSVSPNQEPKKTNAKSISPKISTPLALDANAVPKEIADQIKTNLKAIEKSIILNPSDVKENCDILLQVEKNLIQAMKNNDALFKELYQKTVFTGSYFDGVRIKAPDEFDLNLVLALPFSPDDIKLSAAKDAPTFVHYQLKRQIELIFGKHPKWTPTLYHRLTSFFDDKLFLKRDSIQTWIQGLIAKVKNNIDMPRNVAKVETSQSGPAFTFYIFTKSNTKIDVDFVPVIDGSKLPYPPGFRKPASFNKLNKEAQVFFLVPKPTKGAAPSSKQAAEYWRVSFPEAEKKLTYSSELGCVKLLIKLFKLLRDNQNWKSIASYYIKTIFLWEIEKTQDKNHWKEDRLGYLFIEMLQKLKKIIDKRELQYYFIGNGSNLLSGLQTPESNSMSNFLANFIAKLLKNPADIFKYMQAPPA